MQGFLPSHMTPWVLWITRVETPSVLCTIACVVIPCPIWCSSPSLPSLCTFGLPAFPFRLVRKYLSEALAPGLTTKLSTGMQDLESKAHTGPLAIVQIFLCFAIFLGRCPGSSKGTPLSRRYRCLCLITYSWLFFSTILNSREAFFLLRGDGFPSSNCLKPLTSPSFPDVWLTQGFSVFG